MVTPSSRLHRLLAISCAANLFFTLLVSTKTSAQSRSASDGKIIGTIDGISYDGDQSFIFGWACQQGLKNAIAVHVVDDKGIHLTYGMANLFSEPAVQKACQDNDAGNHRFFIVLPVGFDRNKTLQVEAFIPGHPERGRLNGSSTRLRVFRGLDPPFPPPPPPRLSGSYHSLAEHPRVFMTADELKQFASRINRPGSYSKARFDQLVASVAHDLTSGINWDATYSGCNPELYQYAYSMEVQNGFEEKIREAVHLPPNAKGPAGAAFVASRLALYAALVKAGASLPDKAPSVDQAIALSKHILLAWADHGFPRDFQGHFLKLAALSCRDDGKGGNIVDLNAAEGPALNLGRGVFYSVHAQDLLQYLGALDASEVKRLNLLHSALFDLLRESENVKFGYGGIPFPAPPVGRFTNVDAVAQLSLLAIARLEDDERKFNAVLYGGDPAVPMALPWIRLFNRLIYGENDKPHECVPFYGESDNPFECSHPANDPAHWPFFQTANVAPGEVSDRYRNEHTGNSIGYSMGVLRSLIAAGEILRNADFDAYGYRGDHKQSIEMAISYYSCFAKNAGFYKVITKENSGACPNAFQYYGKLVNDVDRVVMFGAYRYPGNASITSVEAAAKAMARNFYVDTIVFGGWSD